MRTNHDNPIDSLGSIGSPIRQPAPAKPDPAREFERISDHSKALETVAETLRKPAAPVSPGKAEEWEGLCLDPVALSFLNFI